MTKTATGGTEAPSTTPSIVLPLTPIKSTTQSPKNLIIFSKPKAGKTTILSKLDNCLILDLEDGSDYVDALKIKARSVQDIVNIGKAIKEAGFPYKYIAIDTVTALEEICVNYAEELYSKSPMGKNWYIAADGGKAKYGNILNLPDGGGYKWLKQAFEKILGYIEKLAPRIILVGHVKDIFLAKEGAEFTSADLDLTGKLKRSASSDSDAIGYLFRKKNQTIISFKSSDEVACGARPDHLRGKEIVISEEIDGTVYTYWDRIYLD